MSDSKPESVPENKKGFTVNASPFNQVKLELGAIIVIGVFLVVVNEMVTESLAAQFMILLGYGVTGMSWLIYRVKQVMKKNQDNPNG